MTRITITVLVCLLALSAAGCAVELPMSAFSGSRLAPPDATLKSDVRLPQDVKHISID